MNPLQYDSKTAFIQAFPNEEACMRDLQKTSWKDGVVSPFDPTSKVKEVDGNKYLCESTGKTFDALTGTIYEGSDIPLHTWFLSTWVLTHQPNLNSIKLAEELSVSHESAMTILKALRTVSEKVDLSNFESVPSKMFGHRNSETTIRYIGDDLAPKQRMERSIGQKLSEKSLLKNSDQDRFEKLMDSFGVELEHDCEPPAGDGKARKLLEVKKGQKNVNGTLLAESIVFKFDEDGNFLELMIWGGDE